MVDEPDLDLAGRDGLDDRRVLLVELRVVRLQRPRATAASAPRPRRAASRSRTPGRRRSSAAIPILPFHFGSVRSKTESGTSSSRQLVGVVDDHARAAGGADPAAVVVAEALVDPVEDVAPAARRAARRPSRASRDPGRRRRRRGSCRPPRRSSPRARRCRRSGPRPSIPVSSSNRSKSGATSSSSRPE